MFEDMVTISVNIAKSRSFYAVVKKNPDLISTLSSYSCKKAHLNP